MPGELRRIVFAGLAVALAAAATAAIIVVLAGDLGDDGGRVLLTLISVFVCGAAAVAAYGLVERRRLPWLGAAVLAALVPVLVVSLVGDWKAILGDGTNQQAKLIPTGLAWAIAFLVIATLPHVASDPRTIAALLAVAAAAVSGAALATGMIWTETGSDPWLKALAVLAIVMAAGWLIAPLAERAARRRRTAID